MREVARVAQHHERAARAPRTPSARRRRHRRCRRGTRAACRGAALPETMALGCWSANRITSNRSRSLPAFTSALCSVVYGNSCCSMHPARPALVHAGRPGLIEADARRLDRRRRHGRAFRRGARLQSQRGRHLLDGLQRHAGHLDGGADAARIAAAGRDTLTEAPGFQQPVDRDGALGAGVVEGEDGARARHRRRRAWATPPPARGPGPRAGGSSRTSRRRRATGPATRR